MSIKDKLTSRKFWVAVAAMLGSIGTSIAGIQSGNDMIATVGIVCTVISAAIYAACEAYVDGKAVNTEVIDTLAKLLENGAQSENEGA